MSNVRKTPKYGAKIPVAPSTGAKVADKSGGGNGAPAPAKNAQPAKKAGTAKR